MLYRWIRKQAFRRGYDFTLRRLPQYAIQSREMKVPRDMEAQFVELFAATREFTLTSVERMYALYGAIRYIHEAAIDGDVVECGVWRGGSCMLAAGTLLSLGDTTRGIHLYDTFAGMTRPEAVDTRQRDGSEQISRWEVFQREGHNDWCYASLEEVRGNLLSTGYPEGQLSFVQGPVEQTLPGHAPARIALLRLDTDWYSSTLHELEHLYPRLAPRGVLIIDDYGAYEGAREAVDRYFRENGVQMLLHRIDTAGRIGVKPG